MRRDTLLQHLGEEKTGVSPVVPPIVQTSLFVHPDLDSFWGTMFDHTPDKERYIYSRVGNPNLTVAEKKLAALEGTESALLFSSGMAAITAALMSTLEAGAHLVYVDTIYGPTKQWIEQYLPRFGITSTPVRGDSLEEIEAALTPTTKAIYLESPSSVVFRLQDLREISELARARGIITLIDNSYASPVLQNPAEFGIDLVCHSATKYISGHSDVVAGLVCGSKERLTQIMSQEGQWFGGLLAPFPAWLLLRGLRTMPLRVKASQACGEALFQYLQTQPKVEQIFHVGDPDSAQRALFESQMRGSVSLLSFRPKDQDLARIKEFVHALEVFQLGVSWGGFESLVVPIPLSTQPEPHDWVIRLYGGLEDPQDLVDDLDRAFKILHA